MTKKTNVVLYGKLKELYAEPISLQVHSVAEAVRALCRQVKGFRKELSQGHYRVFVGGKDKANTIDGGVINFNFGSALGDIHIEPVMEGNKGGGGKILAGVALIALSFATGGIGFAAGLGFQTGAGGVALAGIYGGVGISGASIAGLGISLALSGVSQALTPKVKSPEASSFERPDERPSYLYNGATNTTEQGGAVPLVYGIMMVGSVTISSGLTVERL